MKAQATVVLLAALASGAAVADCENAVLKERPDVPDGSVASFDEMFEAREAVVAYVDAAEAYIACVEPEPFQHNFFVQRIERVADEFNRERERYLERQEALAVN